MYGCCRSELGADTRTDQPARYELQARRRLELRESLHAVLQHQGHPAAKHAVVGIRWVARQVEEISAARERGVGRRNGVRVGGEDVVNFGPRVRHDDSEARGEGVLQAQPRRPIEGVEALWGVYELEAGILARGRSAVIDAGFGEPGELDVPVLDVQVR